MKEHTAILIFSNSCEADSRIKKIKKGKLLFNHLNEKVVKVALRTELPVEVISSNEQIGSSFKERFYNAIQHVYSKGFENVIIIGNDTPQLSTQHILSAYNNLKNNKISIGPSTDGGFYLLAISKTIFQKINFFDYSWQTQTLLSELLNNLKNLDQDPLILNLLADIDSIDDLKTIQNYSKYFSSVFKRIISEILSISPVTFEIENFYFNSYFTKIPLNKGSPA